MVNNKLAEIYFDRKQGQAKIFGHFYANKKYYKTKEEQKWITQDTAKVRLIYRNSKYKRLKDGDLVEVDANNGIVRKIK